MDTEYIKKCPQCKSKYEANRLNQKFCSMKCKARYNNNKARKRNSTLNDVAAPINAILWNNRNLLAANEDKSFDKDAMLKVGFKFNYITRFGQDEDGGNLLYCYDYGYSFIDANTIKIFKA